MAVCTLCIRFSALTPLFMGIRRKRKINEFYERCSWCEITCRFILDQEVVQQDFTTRLIT